MSTPPLLQQKHGNGESFHSSREERSRSRSKDGREREKDKERERERDKKRRERSRDRHRESKDGGDRKSRDRDRDRHHDNRDRDRERRNRDRDRDRRDRERDRRERDRERRRDSRERDRGRESKSFRSRSRDIDDYEDRRRRRSRSRRQERERSRSPSLERQAICNFVEKECEREMKLQPIAEETSSRDSRFDLTQTIQELMNNSAASKGFAALFNCNNSNDSCSNEPSENSQDAIERKRRRKSRWGGTENDKTFIPGMPTILPSTLDQTQQEAYLVQLQIEEISRKLRTGDLGIPQNPEERSPSPEPIYSSDGKRLNTREFRFRKRLEEQRHQLIQKMQSVNPEFKPPADYKPPVTRVSDKVLIPQEQHPDINFVGLLIGPRGNTLKAMEKETGAKIIIRGKGSVKEGKVGRKDGQPLPGEDEPLHAFITAPNPEAVKKAVDKIKDVIRQGIEVPEGHNDLRRMQLRELAQLNGTLRETDCSRCSNCGSTEHKTWLCPSKPNVTNSIVCTSCGGAGHISRDCRSKRPGSGTPGEDTQAKIDEEYMSLMAELGEGPLPSVQQKSTASVDPLAQVHINRGYSLFDKKPTTLSAIQAASPTMAPTTVAPPPLISSWGNATVASMVAIPPLIPPPPAVQPAPPAPPPLMPWVSAPQPPPPGGDVVPQPPIPGASVPPPPPPGTTSLVPPLIPPPPGTSVSAPLPPTPWASTHGAMPPGGYSPWGGANGNYNGNFLPPPPPPGMPALAQPPPPPPPCN